MQFVAVGSIIPTAIHLNHEAKSATTTLRDGQDRFMLSSVGLEQFEILVELSQRRDAVRVFVMGYGYTFKTTRCSGHHFGMEPLFLIPIKNQEHEKFLLEVAQQWMAASLAVTLFNHK